MANLLFAIKGDRQFMTLEGDDAIHDFVELNRPRFPDFETTIESIYKRIGLLKPNPLIRDRLMGRLFLIPDFKICFNWLNEMSDENFEMHIRNIKDHLGYMLFPMAPEFEKNVEEFYGLRFGGALLRSVSHVPKASGTFSYFQLDMRKTG